MFLLNVHDLKGFSLAEVICPPRLLLSHSHRAVPDGNTQQPHALGGISCTQGTSAEGTGFTTRSPPKQFVRHQIDLGRRPKVKKEITLFYWFL